MADCEKRKHHKAPAPVVYQDLPPATPIDAWWKNLTTTDKQLVQDLSAWAVSH